MYEKSSVCPLCGTKLILVSISCGKNPSRKYICPKYRCGWKEGTTYNNRKLASLCGDPTCESYGCTQQALDDWYAMQEDEARRVVRALLNREDIL